MKVSAGFNKARFGLSPFNTSKRITRILDLTLDTNGIGLPDCKIVRITGIKDLDTIGIGEANCKIVRIKPARGKYR